MASACPASPSSPSSASVLLWSAADWLSSYLRLPLLEASDLGIAVDGHLILEVILVVVILLLMTQKSYKPDRRPLTEKEINQLCEEWTPEPLIPTLPPAVVERDAPVLESAAEPWTTVNGRRVLNLSSLNFLGLVGNERVKKACTVAVSKYGVGSCGPRGFYGTIDVHMDLEESVARFMGTEDCILYSYGLSTASSAIPAFCKRGDLIVADEAVGWAIQNGLTLSRSTVRFFRHNDMQHLDSILKEVDAADRRKGKRGRPLQRRFIVVESIYLSTGRMVPLDEVVRLKEQYHYRVVVDESLTFGTLGSTGRGISEHFGIPASKLDIIIAAMGTTLASAGGFCCGSTKVVDHQRLGGLGYCFSASLPPFLASAALTALQEMEDHPDLRTRLLDNICAFRQEMESSSSISACDDGTSEPVLAVEGHPLSPVQMVLLHPSIHRLCEGREREILQHIVDQMLSKEDVLLWLPERSPLDATPPSVPCSAAIRVALSAGHAPDDVVNAVQALKKVATMSVNEVCR